jgi:hypothetical protein
VCRVLVAKLLNALTWMWGWGSGVEEKVCVWGGGAGWWVRCVG